MKFIRAKRVNSIQYCCTYIRVHRRSSTSTYPRKRYATMRAVRRYIHTYISYHLQQRNNELMKFIRAKRANSIQYCCTYIRVHRRSSTSTYPRKRFRPWTHTSDDSYFYQLSLVVATATVSFERSEFLIPTWVTPQYRATSKKNMCVCSTNLGFSGGSRKGEGQAHGIIRRMAYRCVRTYR